MQVKKYQATSILEALHQVKKDLGPNAIILSSQESKKSVTGSKKFLVVAAVSEHHLKKKELAEQKLGAVFEDRVQNQSAKKQKMFIESVYGEVERVHQRKNRPITKVQYIDIDDEEESEVKPEVVQAKQKKPVQNIEKESVTPQKNTPRVKAAVAEAVKSSLSSNLFADGADNSQTNIPSHLLQVAQKENTVPRAVQSMSERLIKCGVGEELVKRLETKILVERPTERKALVDSWYAQWILNNVKVTGYMLPTQIEAFVGPHGSGKSTALVQLATYYKMQAHKSVAIITTDFNKVGSIEQMKVYGRILNAPVLIAKNNNDIIAMAQELEGYDKVFIDTPGVSMSSLQDLEFITKLARASEIDPVHVHLVLSCLTKASDLNGLLKRFRASCFRDVIVTNIDQTSQHGMLLNIQKMTQTPFHSFGIGSDVVDGFEFASRERVLDLLFKLTKRIGEPEYDKGIS